MTNDDGKDYIQGPRLTMSFEATPELLDFMRRWSDEVPTLFFLDICAANATKLTPEALERDARKGALVDRLGALDKTQNSFSYLLALAEKTSDPRSGLSDEELENQILGDVAALRSFFQHASVIEADEFISSYLRSLRGIPNELSQQKYLEFLKIANERFELGDPVSKPLRLGRAAEILTEADARDIPRQHPVVLITLACLYGNRSARKIMKFKADPTRFAPENALADIMAIGRFLPRKLEIEQMGREGSARFARCDFVTDDDGLANIVQCFEGKATRTTQVGGVHRTETTVTINLAALMPELPPPQHRGAIDEAASSVVTDEWKRLCDLLAQEPAI